MVQLGCKCSLFITISIIDKVKNLIILLLLLVNATVEKMLQTRRLSAWLININPASLGYLKMFTG
jgi:hypothetical protein